jgi:hypothetical protein
MDVRAAECALGLNAARLVIRDSRSSESRGVRVCIDRSDGEKGDQRFHTIAIAANRYPQLAGFVGKMLRKKNATGGTSRLSNALSGEKDDLFRTGLSLAHRLQMKSAKQFGRTRRV